MAAQVAASPSPMHDRVAVVVCSLKICTLVKQEPDNSVMVRVDGVVQRRQAPVRCQLRQRAYLV